MKALFRYLGVIGLACPLVGTPARAVSWFPLGPYGGDARSFAVENDTSGYAFKEVNLRISRSFRYREGYSLERISEAENLLNAACTTAGCTGAVANTFNARDFKRTTSATDSRQIQIGGSVRF